MINSNYARDHEQKAHYKTLKMIKAKNHQALHWREHFKAFYPRAAMGIRNCKVVKIIVILCNDFGKTPKVAGTDRL